MSINIDEYNVGASVPRQIRKYKCDHDRGSDISSLTINGECIVVGNEWTKIADQTQNDGFWTRRRRVGGVVLFRVRFRNDAIRSRR